MLKYLLSKLLKDKINILIYHRVLPEQDKLFPGEVYADTFKWQMALVKKYFNPISLEEAIEGLKNNHLPPASVCITFDDGYRDNLTHAMPILDQFEIPFTVFIASKFSNGEMMWNDKIIESVRNTSHIQINLPKISMKNLPCSSEAEKRSAIDKLITSQKYLTPEERQENIKYIQKTLNATQHERLMMSPDEIRQLSNNGVEIGGHTYSHPILAKLSSDDAFNEIKRGKEQLEQILNKKVRYFAYPNGKANVDYMLKDKDIVKTLNFEAAVSTEWGVVTSNSDVYQLPRFTPWDTRRSSFFMRLYRNFSNVNYSQV